MKVFKYIDDKIKTVDGNDKQKWFFNLIFFLQLKLLLLHWLILMKWLICPQNRKWFYTLVSNNDNVDIKPKKYKSLSLLEYYKDVDISQKIIVQMTTPNGQRLFSLFDSFS